MAPKKSPRKKSPNKKSPKKVVSIKEQLDKIRLKKKKKIEDWEIIAELYTKLNKDPAKLWAKYTNDYDDIVSLNILFLTGKLSQTPLYAGKLYPETIKQLSQILELHKDYGVITIDSQPGICEYDQKIKLEKLLEKGKQTYDQEQRSYLGAIMKKTAKNKQFAKDVLMKLDKSKYKVAILEFPETKSSLNFVNFNERHNMTRTRTYMKGQTKPSKWSYGTNADPNDPHNFAPDDFTGNASKILKDGSISIFISNTEYCDKDKNVTSLLLELLKKFYE